MIDKRFILIALYRIGLTLGYLLQLTLAQGAEPETQFYHQKARKHIETLAIEIAQEARRLAIRITIDS
jgi:hypothetical protein